MKAKYKCLRCRHKFEGEPGPVQRAKDIETACPKCGHLYLEWLNYEKDYRPKEKK